jgi:hypothetical protein
MVVGPRENAGDFQLVALGFLSLALLSSDVSTSQPPTARQRTAPQAQPSRAEPLAFGELFESSPRELKPTAKLLRLDGKRVKMVGYMAQMEEPPSGAFYLAARPTFCGEGGAGTGDLPPDAVRVVVRSRRGKPVPFIPGPLEVTGILEVGNRAEEDGAVSAIRLVLDQFKDKKAKRQSKRNQT